MPTYDESNKFDQELMKQQMPNTSDLKGVYEDNAKDEAGEPLALDSPEMLAQLRFQFEQMPRQRHALMRDYSDYIGDYDSEYNQVQLQWRDRGATGFESDARMKQMFVEMEYWTEKIIGKKQIETKQLKMYKGTVKKW